jgi:hypothetical protein
MTLTDFLVALAAVVEARLHGHPFPSDSKEATILSAIQQGSDPGGSAMQHLLDVTVQDRQPPGAPTQFCLYQIPPNPQFFCIGNVSPQECMKLGGNPANSCDGKLPWPG